MRRVPEGLLDLDGELDGIPVGETVRVAVQRLKGRSGAFHRKYWALLRVIHSYLENPIDFEVFRKSIQVAVGWYDYGLGNVKIPKSISFRSMPPEQFDWLYDSVLQYALDGLIPTTVSKEDLDKQIEEMILRFG
jgi:hypothetical protein